MVTTTFIEPDGPDKTIYSILDLDEGTLFLSEDEERGIRTFNGWITFSTIDTPVAFVDAELGEYSQFKKVTIIEGDLNIRFTIK